MFGIDISWNPCPITTTIFACWTFVPVLLLAITMVELKDSNFPILIAFGTSEMNWFAVCLGCFQFVGKGFAAPVFKLVAFLFGVPRIRLRHLLLEFVDTAY